MPDRHHEIILFNRCRFVNSLWGPKAATHKRGRFIQNGIAGTMANAVKFLRVASNVDNKVQECRAFIRDMERHKYFLSADADAQEQHRNDCEYLGHLLEELRVLTLALLEIGNLPLLHKEYLAGFRHLDLNKVGQMHDEPEYLYSQPLGYAIRFIDAAKLTADNAEEHTSLIGVLERILRQTPHIFHSQGIKPKREAEVHKPLLDLLSAVFPDTIDRPSIPQISKAYQPDIGIGSLGVAIEIKFSNDKSEIKNHLDQIYADMHGYSGDKWNKFYALIFTTEPIVFEERILANWKLTNADVRWTPIVVYGGGDVTKRSQSAGKKKQNG